MSHDPEFTAAILRFLRSIEGREIPRDPAPWADVLDRHGYESTTLGLFWHARNVGETATPESLEAAISLVRLDRTERRTITRQRDPHTRDLAHAADCPECGAAEGAECRIRGRRGTYRLARRGHHVSRWLRALYRSYPVSRSGGAA